MENKFLSQLCLLFTLILFSSVSIAEDEKNNPYVNALPNWQNVLTKYVDDKGRTDFIALSTDLADLDTFVSAVGEVSPTSHPALFPTSNHVLAYHINTYNALAMRGVIERDIPKNFSSFFKRASFFRLRGVKIGGDKTNLYDYENKVIRPLGEPRTHFALNCMVKDCPRLPQQIFTAQNAEKMFADLTVEFFNTPNNIRVDDDKKRVYLSRIMKFYTKDYVSSGKKDDLIPYVNQYRTDKIPSDYKVKFMDYDWTINQQPK